MGVASALPALVGARPSKGSTDDPLDLSLNHFRVELASGGFLNPECEH